MHLQLSSSGWDYLWQQSFAEIVDTGLFMYIQGGRMYQWGKGGCGPGYLWAHYGATAAQSHCRCRLSRRWHTFVHIADHCFLHIELFCSSCCPCKFLYVCKLIWQATLFEIVMRILNIAELIQEIGLKLGSFLGGGGGEGVPGPRSLETSASSWRRLCGAGSTICTSLPTCIGAMRGKRAAVHIINQ